MYYKALFVSTHKPSVTNIPAHDDNTKLYHIHQEHLQGSIPNSSASLAFLEFHPHSDAGIYVSFQRIEILFPERKTQHVPVREIPLYCLCRMPNNRDIQL